VRRTYFAFWAASAQVEVSSNAAKIAAELARLSEERYRTGGAPRLEVEQSALAMRRAEQEREDRAAEARAAHSELDATLGTQVDAVDAQLQPTLPPNRICSRGPEAPGIAVAAGARGRGAGAGR